MDLPAFWFGFVSSFKAPPLLGCWSFLVEMDRRKKRWPGRPGLSKRGVRSECSPVKPSENGGLAKPPSKATRKIQVKTTRMPNPSKTTGKEALCRKENSSDHRFHPVVCPGGGHGLREGTPRAHGRRGLRSTRR